LLPGRPRQTLVGPELVCDDLPRHRSIGTSQRTFKVIPSDPESPGTNGNRACDGELRAVARQITHVYSIRAGNARSVHNGRPRAGRIDPVDHMLIMATGLRAKAPRVANPLAEDGLRRLMCRETDGQKEPPIALPGPG
jgi:hypothetical protein